MKIRTTKKYHSVKLDLTYIIRDRKDGGFVGIGDVGNDINTRLQTDNREERILDPRQTRRQSRMFSIDVDCLKIDGEHDRIVNKYTQVKLVIYS